MKKHFLLIFALSPLALLVLTLLASKALGCAFNAGPGGTHCQYASDSIGSALVGLMYLGSFGLLFTIPFAMLIAFILAVLGKLTKKSSGQAKPNPSFKRDA